MKQLFTEEEGQTGFGNQAHIKRRGIHLYQCKGT